MANNRLSKDLEFLAREKGLLWDTDPPKRKFPAVTAVHAKASKATTHLSASFLIPVKTVSEMNAREHWATKNRRFEKQRQELDAAFLPVEGVFTAFASWLKKNETGKVRVTFIRIGKKLLDGDNLQSAFKKCRDSVAGWIGVDDGSDRYRWEYEQQTGLEYAVRIKIETELG